MCATDYEVTPIAGNADIEPIRLPPIRLAALPFAQLPLMDLQTISIKDRDSHMKAVATALSKALTACVSLLPGHPSDGQWSLPGVSPEPFVQMRAFVSGVLRSTCVNSKLHD